MGNFILNILIKCILIKKKSCNDSNVTAFQQHFSIVISIPRILRHCFKERFKRRCHDEWPFIMPANIKCLRTSQIVLFFNTVFCTANSGNKTLYKRTYTVLSAFLLPSYHINQATRIMLWKIVYIKLKSEAFHFCYENPVCVLTLEN